MSTNIAGNDSFYAEINNVCEHFEAEWRSGGQPRIDQYAAQAPQRARPELIRELLKLDIYYRRERGDTILTADYLPQFADHGILIDTLLAEPTSAEQPAALTHAGRYRLEGLIGSGGMGDVYRAHDPDFRRPLAVKILKEEFKDRPDMVKRFLGEAKLTGQLEHPGIPPVHEIGTVSDGRPFMAMKLIKGRTLEELLAKRENPAERLQVYIAVFRQVCQTLAFAHSQGVIHRDLKPANIMVGAHGEVQVMDWGLAKARRSGDRIGVPKPETSTAGQADLDMMVGLTKPGAVMGSFAYMPPEQARGEVDRLDERSDVFSQGAILCVILTGQPPYRARSADLLLQQVRSADLAEAAGRLQSCDADQELVTLAKACLVQEMADRPRDASALATAVAAYQAGQQERLHRFEWEREAARVQTHEEKKRRRLTLIMAVTIAAILVTLPLGVFAGTLWWKNEREAAEAEQDRLNNQVAMLEQKIDELNHTLSERDKNVRAPDTEPDFAHSDDLVDSRKTPTERNTPDPANPTLPPNRKDDKAQEDALEREYHALQGTWICVGPQPPYFPSIFVKNKQISVTCDYRSLGSEITTITSRIDPTQRPWTISLPGLMGTRAGAYERNGSRLTIEFEEHGIGGFLGLGVPQSRKVVLVYRRLADEQALDDLRMELSDIKTDERYASAMLRFIKANPKLGTEDYLKSLEQIIPHLTAEKLKLQQLLREAPDPDAKAKNPEPKPVPTLESRREDKAGGMLRVANLLHAGGNMAMAKEKYKEIVNKFPQTKAGEEARALLKKLGD